MQWWQAFALTLLVEVPVVMLLLRRHCSPTRAALLGLLMNCLTHPVLWFGLSAVVLPLGGYLAVTAAAELVVVAVEAGVLWLGLRRRVAGGELLLVAGIVNISSVLVGLLISRI